MSLQERLWALLGSQDLDIVSIQRARLAQGLPMTADEEEAIISGITEIILDLERARGETVRLAQAYNELRAQHCITLSRLHAANPKVAKAAIQHQDKNLAILARDVLYGEKKADAMARIPSASQILKQVRNGAQP